MCKIERGRHVFLRLPYVTSTVPGAVNADLSHNPILGPTCERLEMCFFKGERTGKRRETNGGDKRSVSAPGKNCTTPSERHPYGPLSVPPR